jgi:hypothetical protein
MHTYISATKVGLPVNPDLGYQNLYLDVNFQLEDSEVVVRSVRYYGGGIAPVLSKDARLAIVQRIQDRLESICDY